MFLLLLFIYNKIYNKKLNTVIEEDIQFDSCIIQIQICFGFLVKC